MLNDNSFDFENYEKYTPLEKIIKIISSNLFCNLRKTTVDKIFIY